jgi:hypothetical protein
MRAPPSQKRPSGWQAPTPPLPGGTGRRNGTGGEANINRRWSIFRRAYLEGFWLSHLDAAYTLPFLGRVDDAKTEVAKLLKLRPDFTIREADAFYRMYCFTPEYIEKMNDALRQAGLPE